MSLDLPGTLQSLEHRVRTLLPEIYQDRYDTVKPVSMGSAGIKYGKDGKVAWDDMWGSFCDLAMAGGPPHKGSLLEPASAAEIEQSPDHYAEVAAEITRGLHLVAELPAQASSEHPGWIAADCEDETMAEWLTRAILMENVSAFRQGTLLHLPAGPAYRIEKEIKNVITAVAKTSHYWLDHTWLPQRREIEQLFAQMEAVFPTLRPSRDPGDLTQTIANHIASTTRLRASDAHYPGWCGLDCPDVDFAIWMMRALVASNVLARRQATTLYVPVNPQTDPNGTRVASMVTQLYNLKLRDNLHH
ncbi:hypothetical protein F183_A21970 [Bryobacterales bacterium F-183]|nr:hypothetical protein F183_A21970 [Bryobacterales bacterium F-183]